LPEPTPVVITKTQPSISRFRLGGRNQREKGDSGRSGFLSLHVVFVCVLLWITSHPTRQSLRVQATRANTPSSSSLVSQEGANRKQGGYRIAPSDGTLSSHRYGLLHTTTATVTFLSTSRQHRGDLISSCSLSPPLITHHSVEADQRSSENHGA
jgi:hypothetical protein